MTIPLSTEAIRAAVTTPVTAYTVGMALATLGALLLGTLTFIPRKQRRPRVVVRELVRTDWKYLGVAWAVTLVVNELAFRFHADRLVTDTVYALEGPVVAAFQTVTTPALTFGFAVLYLVGFPFLVLFSYFKLKVHDREQACRYAMGYALLVVVAAPLFLAFPVRITGQYLPTVDPLLLTVHPVVGEGVLATDTLVKAFPSLHTGLSVLAALYARHSSRRYATVAGVLAAGIVVSTFYLGIHWLVDAMAAAVLAGAAYHASQRFPLPRFARRSSGRTSHHQQAD
ncbi:phosphatase PAP2 family protein [Halomarina litorea]|uniref:phosphatase PAP2 family protein n=1 Tax=Halomarina litorea TaxID=2961595 RepID=UPI0020C4F143|nr:phosphatase PAP2 family protein [Halomarina sp. BCD28]